MIRIFFLSIICISTSHLLFSQIHFLGRVSFVSSAPLELIKAESKMLNGLVNLEKKTFAFSVKLRTMEGFNSYLQKEHFHENYLESDKYPILSYSGKMIDHIPLDRNGTYSVRTKGFFVIHGVSRERILTSNVTIKNNKIRIDSNFEILLSDYDIDIPRIVHKKISESVKISIKAESVDR